MPSSKSSSSFGPVTQRISHDRSVRDTSNTPGLNTDLSSEPFLTERSSIGILEPQLSSVDNGVQSEGNFPDTHAQSGTRDNLSRSQTHSRIPSVRLSPPNSSSQASRQRSPQQSQPSGRPVRQKRPPDRYGEWVA